MPSNRSSKSIRSVLHSSRRDITITNVHLDDNEHNNEFFNFVTVRTNPIFEPGAGQRCLASFVATRSRCAAMGHRSNRRERKSARDCGFLHRIRVLHNHRRMHRGMLHYIYDGNGDLVWSGAPVFDGFTTFDFRVVNIQGEQMLSVVYPRGGKAIIFDDGYQIHKIIDMGDENLRENEVGLNPHEFTTSTDGAKALFLTRLPKRTSMRNSVLVNFNDECYAIFDGIKEIDTRTWNTSHMWNSEGPHWTRRKLWSHMALYKSDAQEKRPWDFL